VKKHIHLFLFIIFGMALFLGICSLFVSFDYLLLKFGNIFHHHEGIIKPESYLFYKKKLYFLKTIFIAIPFFVILYLLIWEIADKWLTRFNLKIISVYERIKIPINFWIIFGIISSIGLIFYAVFNFDIGLDESFYVNDIQNISNMGFPIRDYNSYMFSYLIFDLPFNLPAIFIKYFFGFSYINLRLIIVFYSLLTFVLFYKVFSNAEAKIISLLIFLFPGICYLTSCVFLEMIAFFWLLLGILFLKKFEISSKQKYFSLAAISFGIAISAKFQVFLFLGLIFAVLFIIDRRRFLIFRLALFSYLVYFGLFIISFVLIGKNDSLIMIKDWILAGDTNGAFKPVLSNIINKFFWLNELVLCFPVLIFIWIKTYHLISGEKKLFLKFIYIGAIVLPLYWLLLSNVVNWRNIFIGLAFNGILAGILLAENKKNINTILITYILSGILINFGFIRNGSLNDVDYYRAHVLPGFLSFDGKHYQKDFFKAANEIIKETDTVYTAGDQPYIPRIYFKNHKIRTFKDVSEISSNAFIVITAGEISEGFATENELRWFEANCESIKKYGNYLLYKKPMDVILK
jgi:hypothetical protein